MVRAGLAHRTGKDTAVTVSEQSRGRIRDDDIATVRERVRIDDVVREVVTLKSAGGGSLKGLCPFHDERSPSFHVTPARGMYYCFGCGEGGDVITFVQKTDHLTFAEAVEKLAGRVGVDLRYEGGGAGLRNVTGQRTRLVEAHRKAEAFYRDQLTSEESITAQRFLAERGFDDDATERFGVGYAPRGWDSLTTHLRGQGFTDAELLAAGLVAKRDRGGIYDRFRGRLVWPIRDLAGDTIGFGARKLYDDDDGPKYLNTPETVIYKKSHALYGIDLARRDIAKTQQAVVVEGYTDVMACHLAGVTTAVATCGTAFGTDHIKVLRRLLMDDETMRGQVTFTFDGDAAGQKAALRAFDEDQRFVAQTYVAVQPDGLDPCDLRLTAGDQGIHDLINARQPLFAFAIRSALAAHDLDQPEGRSAALSQVAPIIAAIRDQVLRGEYVRLVSGWLGMNTAAVTTAVQQEARKPRKTLTRPETPTQPVNSPTALQTPPNPDGARATVGQFPDPFADLDLESDVEPPAPLEQVTEPAPPPLASPAALLIERDALRCALHHPTVAAEWYATVEPSAYTHPKAAAVHRAITAAGGPSTTLTGRAWVDAVLAAAENDEVRHLIHELAVDPLPVLDGQEPVYVISVLARLLEFNATRLYEDALSRLQRAEANGNTALVADISGEVQDLGEYRRQLREEAFGSN